MPHAPDIRAIAREMKAAQDDARQVEPFTSRVSGFDVASAYEVARLIHEARVGDGAVAVGRKIGFTNPDMWSLYGVREPIWAHVYHATVVYLPATRATCSIERLVEPQIEPEIVFHLRRAPPVDGDLPAILECIDWVAHAFEIVQSHFPAWKFQAADAVADGALHGTLLVGEPRAVDRMGTGVMTALERFSISLSCDREVRATGVGSNVLGSPLAAIAHLIAVLAKQPHCMPLQANEIITTGTVTTAQSVHVGQTWRTALQGIALPDLCVELVV